jgi:beta-glucosidase
MKQKITITSLACILAFSMLYSFTPNKSKYYTHPFQNPALNTDVRVRDLISKMTLEEKVSQMLNSAPAITRLGVPAYNWWNESLHGVARTPYKVTVYPQAIAMAATWDRSSLHQMADYTAEEGRAIYNESIKNDKHGIYLGLTYWTPNINIFRDPRWGRGQETYGEDPYLTGEMGSAFVSGLQGNDPDHLKAAACAKHYAVHSGPEELRHKFNTDISDYDLWDTYLPAFRKLVVDAKVAGVMCAYNAFKGQPCCGSDLLMNSILHDKWKFKGYVTSDCGGIEDFYKEKAHLTHPDAESAAADAVLHGTDVECGKVTYLSLVNAVKDGKLTEKQIDQSLYKLFTVRFKLGMFDPADGNKYNKIGKEALGAPEHTAQALKMAHQSIVLLKNDGLLPLSKSLKKVAVLGPNADNAVSVLGNYNGTPNHVVTALEGIKNKLLPGSEVIYDKAVDFVGDSLNNFDFKATIDKVKDADVIIYVGGISPQLEGEEMRVNKQGFKGGDRTTIALPAIQTELLKALKGTGKPVVFIMMTGSAIATPWDATNLPAIINSWYGGQASGTALADVLFGDYNPAGRLPVTFYASDKDLPDFTDYSMNNRTYRYFKGVPLFKFGYGLSYSTFQYSALKIPKTLKKGNALTVQVNVKNASKINGEEVTEFYVSHPGVKQTTAIRALKGFERNFIKAGETKTLTFKITPNDLAIVDSNGNLKMDAGTIEISVGGSQPDPKTLSSKKTIDKLIKII